METGQLGGEQEAGCAAVEGGPEGREVGRFRTWALGKGGLVLGSWVAGWVAGHSVGSCLNDAKRGSRIPLRDLYTCLLGGFRSTGTKG